MVFEACPSEFEFVLFMPISISSHLLSQGGFPPRGESGGLFQSSRVLDDSVDLVVG